MASVYMHRNKENGKVYIGKTSQDPHKRWGNNGRRYIETKKDGTFIHPKFARAILKYGWDNFDHIIMRDNLTEEEACDLERDLIKAFNSCGSGGYNITEGGEGTPGSTWSEEQRKKFHEARVGHPPSEAAMNTMKYKFGKTCRIVELDMLFESSGDCAKYLDVTKAAVKAVLKGRSQTCKGYHIVYA